MTFITMRRAVLSDASTLAGLAARTFAETFAADNSPENLQAYLSECFGLAQKTAELMDPDVTSLLTIRDDEAIGFAQLRRKAATGDTWNMTGLQSRELSSTNLPARLTHWSLQMIPRNRR